MDNPHYMRRIRSFVLRQGHLSTGQERAIAEFGPKYLIEYKPEPLDLDAAFGRHAPRILEIGFGMGQATAQIAGNAPEQDFLGCEVHTPGVGSLLKFVGEQNLTNIRIVQHDVVDVLEHMIAPAALDGVHVFFPDPWHKKRHNKRRLIQPGFLKLLVSRIKQGGYVHLATDWEDYAIQMLEVLSAESALQNTAEGYAPRPEYRPLTKFEQRGINLGHGVWDLVFKVR
ncbi:tRNA (guanosine(46)-N7)-methyltransferase TrmB [Silvimonas iriomotensis]|uniref:tRNA (guanine-N(7)-)-methyltransferase n=1 Tax=Silvimonas iriomotensis TaxID=449662 RepID=A0ABQ2PE57_9NEIS|nr:tRNA (guanosine(46)-N7)-methyltransferase TrmB [Silvimonas iriomotensis]GGP23445.1 tRNA (guanine-N(7)-)-methyltransferase [Silvimonas iriomotensis]